jgi:hypothetical protein
MREDDSTATVREAIISAISDNLALLAACCIVAWPFMVAWNYAVAENFKLHAVTYWQSVAMVFVIDRYCRTAFSRKN